MDDTLLLAEVDTSENNGWKKLWKKVAPLVGKVVDSVGLEKKDVVKIARFVVDHSQEVYEKVKPHVDKAIEFYEENADWIDPMWERARTGLAEVTEGASEPIFIGAEMAFDGYQVMDGMGGPDAVIEVVETLDGTIGAIVRAFEDAGEWIATAADDVGDWTETAVMDAAAWGSTAIDDIGDAFESFFSGWAEIEAA